MLLEIILRVGVLSAVAACIINNGGCEHVCLPASSTERTCRCAEGYTQNGLLCHTGRSH